MSQQNSLIFRTRNVQTMFVWVALAFLMCVGTAQAASFTPSEDAKDHTVSSPWEFVFGDWLCSCTVGSETYFAPPHKAAELAAATGAPVSEGTLSSFISNMPPASSGSSVRFEGGAPVGSAISALANKGYTDASSTAPSPGFQSATLYTP